jgi:DNA polymerase-1
VEIWGAKEVCERWGIQRVEQVIDMLALMGDAVDNIPGLPGIGEKTAAKLLQEFDNVENLLANADKLKGKQQEIVKNHPKKPRSPSGWPLSKSTRPFSSTIDFLK